MSKTKLNIGMIGSGFIGKVHSNAFRQVGHFFEVPYEVRLQVICGRDRAKLETAASRWGWSEIETDWEKVIARKDIDAVDIAVPNALHSAIAIAAAEAGKMVLCEKPLASTLEEAEIMTKAVQHTPNMVWFNFRRVPAIVFAKQLIMEGRIGQPFHYRALYLNQSGNDPAKANTWRYKRSEAGMGAAGDLLSHSIDIALYLNGPIKELAAMTHTFARGRDVDDAALLMARFANGSIGTFEATRYGVGCQNRNTFELNGSKGMLSFTLDDMNQLDFFDATEPINLQGRRSIAVTALDHPYGKNFWKPGHVLGYEHPFIATLADFLNSIGGQEPFQVNFEDALVVQRILDAIERSSASRGWVRVDAPAA
ncbi:MAG: Gfo/Idh/MocA family oxidoreductase [Terriglobales bacterium]